MRRLKQLPIFLVTALNFVISYLFRVRELQARTLKEHDWAWMSQFFNSSNYSSNQQTWQSIKFDVGERLRLRDVVTLVGRWSEWPGSVVHGRRLRAGFSYLVLVVGLIRILWRSSLKLGSQLVYIECMMLCYRSIEGKVLSPLHEFNIFYVCTTVALINVLLCQILTEPQG